MRTGGLWEWQLICGSSDESSSSIMTPFYANASCDPFTARETPCTLGAYVQYAVDVDTPEDVAATMKFCRDHNIRFVIRNTGHWYVSFNYPSLKWLLTKM